MHPSGGFVSHSAPPSRAGFPAVGRTSFMGTPQLRYGGVPSSLRFPTRAPIAIDSHRRPVRPIGDRRPHIPFYGAGIAYGYPGYISPGYLGSGFLDYPDSGPYDASSYAAPQQPASYPTNESEAPAEQSDAMPPTAYRPAYARPQPSPEPEAEPPVTLIYKDGRPSEQIQNYMLTRTTIYVQETRLREISVDQLDLAATQKANKDAGIDFQLPGARR
jgi:hypothetical protein